jgi:hypothetical protein
MRPLPLLERKPRRKRRLTPQICEKPRADGAFLLGEDHGWTLVLLLAFCQLAGKHDL